MCPILDECMKIKLLWIFLVIAMPCIWFASTVSHFHVSSWGRKCNKGSLSQLKGWVLKIHPEDISVLICFTWLLHVVLVLLEWLLFVVQLWYIWLYFCLQMTDLDCCVLKECDSVSKECIFSCFHQDQCPLFLLWNSVERAPSGDSW